MHGLLSVVNHQPFALFDPGSPPDPGPAVVPTPPRGGLNDPEILSYSAETRLHPGPMPGLPRGRVFDSRDPSPVRGQAGRPAPGQGQGPGRRRSRLTQVLGNIGDYFPQCRSGQLAWLQSPIIRKFRRLQWSTRSFYTNDDQASCVDGGIEVNLRQDFALAEIKRQRE